MLHLGIVGLPANNRSSPLHLLWKKTEGGWYQCGDYRALHARTVPDRCLISHIHDYVASLTRQVIFSKIDLVEAYHQIPDEPADVRKTAIVTLFGFFRYVRKPFGLWNATQTFQFFIDEVVRGLDFVFAYFDDLLVTSTSADEYDVHLRVLFACL